MGIESGDIWENKRKQIMVIKSIAKGWLAFYIDTDNNFTTIVVDNEFFDTAVCIGKISEKGWIKMRENNFESWEL